MTEPQRLKLKNAETLAYHQLEGASPGIVFMGGFRSDMTGTKAVALETFCRERGQAFLRFDYRGHGQSSRKFEDCTLSIWLEDCLTVMGKLTTGPQLLVGSSMGGWLALLTALLKPRRVAGIVGIASAPDFTEHLVFEKLTKAQQATLAKDKKVTVPSDTGEPYIITQALIEDGRNYLLLDDDIAINCPVRLLHGMEDKEVPWEVSLSLNEKIASQDVKTILVDHGDHRLSKPADLAKLCRVVGKMLDGLAARG